VLTDLDVPETATGRLPRAQRTREGLAAEAVEDLGETGKRHRSAGHGGAPGADSTDGERPARSRSGRPRRRTRGGSTAPAAVGTPSESAGEQPSASTAPGEAGSGAAKRRRRRRRGGANRGGSESAA
jgi:hypothetical protein